MGLRGLVERGLGVGCVGIGGLGVGGLGIGGLGLVAWGSNSEDDLRQEGGYWSTQELTAGGAVSGERGGGESCGALRRHLGGEPAWSCGYSGRALAHAGDQRSRR